jgi:hypothetical protein
MEKQIIIKLWFFMPLSLCFHAPVVIDDTQEGEVDGKEQQE